MKGKNEMIPSEYHELDDLKNEKDSKTKKNEKKKCDSLAKIPKNAKESAIFYIQTSGSKINGRKVYVLDQF